MKRQINLLEPELTPLHNHYLWNNKYMTVYDLINELISIAEDYGTDTLVDCRSMKVEHMMADGIMPIRICTFIKV